MKSIFPPVDRSHIGALGAATILIGIFSLGAPAQAGSPGQAVADKALGFAVTSYPFAIYKGANDCPDGMALAAKELFLMSVAPAERVRLNKPENTEEFEKRAYHTPDGKDLCEVPDYPRPPQRTSQGHISYGMNLDGTTDGAATPNTCAHEKLTGPDGTPTIDNQSYRVLGCSSNYRGPPGEMGYLDSLRNSGLKDGGTTILIELIGVKDAHNDDDIQVGIYNGADPMVVDATGHMLPYASLSMTDDKKFQTLIHGRIKDGVVTTDAGDITLHYDLGGSKKRYDLKAARLRLELSPDGTAKGLLAGYLPLSDVDFSRTSKQAGAEMVGYDCPSFTQAFQRYADAYPDPKTGQCTAISTAFEIQAIPVFIVHPEGERKTAQITGTP
jgi:hypothetical protein